MEDVTEDQTPGVLWEVRRERKNQDLKWGQQDHGDFEWVSILTEEVGEAATDANEANFPSGRNVGDYSLLRSELLQVAAVAVAWVEAIDRRMSIRKTDSGG